MENSSTFPNVRFLSNYLMSVVLYMLIKIINPHESGI